MTEGMRAFARKYNLSLTDPKLRALYELELSAQRDQASRDYNNRMEGRAEGVNNERLSVVRRALAQNLSKEIIYALVDAPRHVVDTIIEKVQSEK